MNHIYHLPEHQTLRDQVQRFIDREVEPHAMAWEHAGSVPRDVLKRMGDAGFFWFDVRERVRWRRSRCID